MTATATDTPTEHRADADVGATDATVRDFVGNVAEKVGATISRKVAHPLVERYAELFKNGARTPVLRRPSDYGMDYDDVSFPSMDGVPLEAWFIPTDSDKLLIVNHPMTCNRYGFPGHLPPWNTMFGGFEVNFLPELRHLHDAGYNILTYDLRNCGTSGEGNGGISGLGLLECRDVVGSIRYARQRDDLATMTTGLYSRCMGGNSTVIAMNRWPDEFTHVKALVLLNIVSGRTFIEKGAELAHADPDKAAAQLDERLRQTTGFRLDEQTPRLHGGGVTVPTLMAQLRRDFLVHGERDGQEIFDALAADDKELLWIDESNQRFYAYNHFGQHPEKLLDWLAAHL